MLYDALTYANQIEERTKNNRKRQKNRREKASSSEFLSGLKKGEQLTPVITLVIYYGKEPWDGPTDLSDMLNMEQVPEEFHPYIQSHYTLNLLEARKIQDYEKFHSDIREVFTLLSCENDKEKMKTVMEQNEKYLHLDRDAVAVIAAMTASKEIMNYMSQEQEGGMDMCQAIREMIEDGRQEGREEGMKLGEQIGKQLGEQKGIRIFILDNMEEKIPKERILEKLQRRFELSIDKAEQYMKTYYTA